MAASVVTSRTRRLGLGGLAVVAVVVAYFVGLIPAAVPVAIDHCYVTYDRLEYQHSRCEGHWTRPGFGGSGTVQGVPVAPNWHALTADPNADYEWEVRVPDASRELTGLTVFAIAWILPGPVASLMTVLAAAMVGLLAWFLLSRYLGAPYRRGRMIHRASRTGTRPAPGES